MSRFAVINKDTDIVTNIIIYDEKNEYYDKTVYLIKSDTANINDRYDKFTQSFIIPVIEIDIEELRNSLKTALNDSLTLHENNGVYYNGNKFSTDNNSQIKYLAILFTVSMDPTFTTVFKSMDDIYVNLTATDIIGLTTTVREYIKKCYMHDDYLTSLIKDAKTIQELQSIDVNLGWPSNGSENINN